MSIQINLGGIKDAFLLHLYLYSIVILLIYKLFLFCSKMNLKCVLKHTFAVLNKLISQ